MGLQNKTKSDTARVPYSKYRSILWEEGYSPYLGRFHGGYSINNQISDNLMNREKSAEAIVVSKETKG